MTILKIEKSSIKGNTVVSAAMKLFNLGHQSEVETKIVGNCDVVVINGSAFYWFAGAESFCFMEA